MILFIFIFLFSGSRVLLQDLKSVLEDDLSPEIKTTRLTSMKMTVYLLCQFMDIFETESAEPSILITTKVSCFLL